LSIENSDIYYINNLATQDKYISDAFLSGPERGHKQNPRIIMIRNIKSKETDVFSFKVEEQANRSWETTVQRYHQPIHVIIIPTDPKSYNSTNTALKTIQKTTQKTGLGYKESTTILLVTVSQTPDYGTHISDIQNFNAKFIGVVLIDEIHIFSEPCLIDVFLICTWCPVWYISMTDLPSVEDIGLLWKSHANQLYSNEVSILDFDYRKERMTHCLDSLELSYGRYGQQCSLHHRILENIATRFNFTPVYYSPQNFSLAKDRPSKIWTDVIYKNHITNEPLNSEVILTVRTQSTTFIYCRKRAKFHHVTVTSIWLSPFLTSVWICLLMGYIGSAFFIWKIACNRNKLKIQATTKSKLEDEVCGKNHFTLATSVFEACAALFSQSVKIRFGLLQLIMTFSSVVMLTHYSTITTRKVIAPLEHVIIHNLKDLVVVNSYKIQFYCPKSAGWAPHYAWFRDAFKSFGILDRINSSFYVNDSDSFPPTEREELGQAADFYIPVAIGRPSVEVPSTLFRLKKLFPMTNCFSVMEDIDRYPKFWRFKYRFSDKFKGVVQSYQIYGFLTVWLDIELNAWRHADASKELTTQEPKPLKLSSKISSIFLIWGVLVWLSILVFIKERLHNFVGPNTRLMFSYWQIRQWAMSHK